MLETNIIAFLYLAAFAVIIVGTYYEYKTNFKWTWFIIFITVLFYFVLKNLFTYPDMINLNGRMAFLGLGLASLLALDGYLVEKMEVEDDDDSIE
jgi:hypothetical protein